MTLRNSLPIDYSVYYIDLLVLANSRILSQFKRSTTGVLPYIAALAEQTQDWLDINIGVLEGRSLAGAVGVQVDVIGRIVGLERPLLEPDEIPYFTPDNDDLGPDNIATWFVKNAPLFGGDVPMSDDIYRDLICAKIFKNQVTACSIGEIMTFIRVAFNVNASVTNCPGEVACIDIHLEPGVPDIYLAILNTVVNNERVENDYFIPVPQGVRLNSITVLPSEPPYFAFDNGYGLPTRGGFDSGRFLI